MKTKNGKNKVQARLVPRQATVNQIRHQTLKAIVDTSHIRLVFQAAINLLIKIINTIFKIN